MKFTACSEILLEMYRVHMKQLIVEGERHNHKSQKMYASGVETGNRSK